jgi:hypothetical protein
MKIRTALLAAGLALAAGSAAAALEGEYTSADGMVTIGFAADGVHTVSVPAAGFTISATYTLEGDMLTLVPPADDATCMGASGTYTVAETDAGATFTVVEDACEQRATTMTAGAWAKKAE